MASSLTDPSKWWRLRCCRIRRSSRPVPHVLPAPAGRRPLPAAGAPTPQAGTHRGPQGMPLCFQPARCVNRDSAAQCSITPAHCQVAFAPAEKANFFAFHDLQNLESVMQFGHIHLRRREPRHIVGPLRCQTHSLKIRRHSAVGHHMGVRRLADAGQCAPECAPRRSGNPWRTAARPPHRRTWGKYHTAAADRPPAG